MNTESGTTAEAVIPPPPSNAILHLERIGGYFTSDSWAPSPISVVPYLRREDSADAPIANLVLAPGSPNGKSLVGTSLDSSDTLVIKATSRQSSNAKLELIVRGWLEWLS
jgi:hypothetical protein